MKNDGIDVVQTYIHPSNIANSLKLELIPIIFHPFTYNHGTNLVEVTQVEYIMTLGTSMSSPIITHFGHYNNTFQSHGIYGLIQLHVMVAKIWKEGNILHP
jgi:hypothetical protein